MEDGRVRSAADRMKYDSLCIFTPMGKTFTFLGVDIETRNETVIQFWYKAMSDGRMKKATFRHAQICGYSLCERGGA